eukprot:6195988-Pleurochrysis_carterae.AAC.1
MGKKFGASFCAERRVTLRTARTRKRLPIYLVRAVPRAVALGLPPAILLLPLLPLAPLPRVLGPSPWLSRLSAHFSICVVLFAVCITRRASCVALHACQPAQRAPDLTHA